MKTKSIILLILTFILNTSIAGTETGGGLSRMMAFSISQDDIDEIHLKDGTVIKFDNLKIEQSKNNSEEILLIDSLEDQKSNQKI